MACWRLWWGWVCADAQRTRSIELVLSDCGVVIVRRWTIEKRRRKLDEDAYAVVKVGSKSVLVSSSSERLYGKHCSQNSKRVLRALVKRHCVRH